MQVRESVSLQPAAVPRLTVRSPPPLSRRAKRKRGGDGPSQSGGVLDHFRSAADPFAERQRSGRPGCTYPSVPQHPPGDDSRSGAPYGMTAPNLPTPPLTTRADKLTDHSATESSRVRESPSRRTPPRQPHRQRQPADRQIGIVGSRSGDLVVNHGDGQQTNPPRGPTRTKRCQKRVRTSSSP